MTASPPLNVLLVEPWFAGSHQSWAEGYAAASRHEITLLTSSGEGWRSTLLHAGSKLASRVEHEPAVVLASAMMDAARFRQEAGLEKVPLVLYMHENQLTYDPDRFDHELAMINWRSVRGADRVLFNSRFHLSDFFNALPHLDIEPGSVAAARDKSQVLPVGIDLSRLDGPSRRRADRFTVLWNHRWEADKDPAAFVEALCAITDDRFHLVLAGERRPEDPHVGRLVDHFRSRILHSGLAPEAQYAGLLRMSDVVVSTARQEFFGVAVAEAAYCGAVPLVPNRLAYPELIPEQFHPALLYADGELADRLLEMADQPETLVGMRPALRAAMSRFDWSEQASRYDDVVEAVV